MDLVSYLELDQGLRNTVKNLVVYIHIWHNYTKDLFGEKEVINSMRTSQFPH